jgi:hypothetical protein
MEMRTMMIQKTKLEADEEQLELTRGALLQHIAPSQIVPDYLMRHARHYQMVTQWEELLCATFDADAGWVRALVMIHRPEGYSGLFRRHASIEYVRFFLDWQDGAGYQPIGLAHFKVCDQRQGTEGDARPRYRRLSVPFDSDRYLGCVMCGLHPKLKAVLSWHQVPELDPDYVPLFGNAIESQICDDAAHPLIEHILSKPAATVKDLPYAFWGESLQEGGSAGGLQ